MKSSEDLLVVIKNLKSARNSISAHDRWHQGDYFSSDGSDNLAKACIQGALQWVGIDPPQCRVAMSLVDPDYEVPKEHRYLYQALLSLDNGRNSVIDFNDAKETTHADVMRLFNRAICLAQADSLTRDSACERTGSDARMEVQVRLG